MFKVLKYIVLFRNTSLYILAGLTHPALHEVRKPRHFSYMLLSQLFANITSVHSSVLHCVRASWPHQVQTLPYWRDCKLRIFSHTQLRENKIRWKASRIFLSGIEKQRNEGGGRIMLGNNTSGGAVMRRMIRFPCFGMWVSTGLPCVEHTLNTRTLNSDLCRPF
jgi:hypothetical protein